MNLGQQHFLRVATSLIAAHTGKSRDEAQAIALEFFTATGWRISITGMLLYQANLVPNSKFRMW